MCTEGHCVSGCTWLCTPAYLRTFRFAVKCLWCFPKFVELMSRRQGELDTLVASGYKSALTEERRRYCFLVDRQCCVTKLLINYHSKVICSNVPLYSFRPAGACLQRDLTFQILPRWESFCPRNSLLGSSHVLSPQNSQSALWICCVTLRLKARGLPGSPRSSATQRSAPLSRNRSDHVGFVPRQVSDMFFGFIINFSVVCGFHRRITGWWLEPLKRQSHCFALK